MPEHCRINNEGQDIERAVHDPRGGFQWSDQLLGYRRRVYVVDEAETLNLPSLTLAQRGTLL